MAYIGKSPVIGNFVKLDSITVVNGQAAYTMQNGGVNFTSYDNVNQFLVSLNGILQAPTDSFTVSGSTLTFASNLSTGDVIDFVIVLGNTLDIGTPSDNTVSLAKLTASGTKDATTFLRGDNSFAVPSGGKILQVVTGTHSTTVTQTANSYATSGVSAAITPASTSNKVLVLTSLYCYVYGDGSNSSGRRAKVGLFRGTVSDTNIQQHFIGENQASASTSTFPHTYGTVAFSHLDSPSTTSSQTYTIGISGDGASEIQAQPDSFMSTITLLEVSA